MSDITETTDHVRDDEPLEISDIIESVQETLAEEELIDQSTHRAAGKLFLRIRNFVTLIAAILFVLSMFKISGQSTLKAIAYFCGAGAYISEYLLLTDCFSRRIEHDDMFMVYCFAPLYILLGVSYLISH